MIIKPGKYQHYKGNYYQVLSTGRHSEDLSEFVVYRALYDSDEFSKGQVWVRPKSLFIDTVIWEGKEVPHFKLVENTIDDGRAIQFISFMKEVEKLKHVNRAILTSDMKRYENSAEHSWHLAILLIILQEYFQSANLEKMLKMALVHDLVEIYTGDVPAFDDQGRIGKKEREQQAAKKLFSQLPAELSKEFHDLFNEFEQSQTQESLIVEGCDKLQAMLQAIICNGKVWKDNELSLEWIEDYHKKHMFDENLSRIYNKLIEQIKDIGGFTNGINEIK